LKNTLKTVRLFSAFMAESFLTCLESKLENSLPPPPSRVLTLRDFDLGPPFFPSFPDLHPLLAALSYESSTTPIRRLFEASRSWESVPSPPVGSMGPPFFFLNLNDKISSFFQGGNRCQRALILGDSPSAFVSGEKHFGAVTTASILACLAVFKYSPCVIFWLNTLLLRTPSLSLIPSIQKYLTPLGFFPSFYLFLDPRVFP